MSTFVQTFSSIEMNIKSLEIMFLIIFISVEVNK